ncbi:Regulator of microtubule dynamics protein 1 [Diplonema papillatum]|nr:Regulator of microtubule dynamics protein 1 [Diplonema papillatum]
MLARRNKKPALKYTKKGECCIKIIEARDLPDSKGDPFVKIYFSKNESLQERQTDIQWKTGNPEWNEQFVFDAVAEKDTVRLSVMDKDITKKDDPIGDCTIKVGGGINEFEGWIELVCPESLRHKEKHRVKQYGFIKVMWMYNVSATAELFAVPHESESEENTADLFEVAASAKKLVSVAYRALVIMFWLIDGFMWEKPFASATQLVIFFLLYFYTTNGLDTMVFAVCAWLLYWTKRKIAFEGIHFAQKLDWSIDRPLPPRSTVPLAKLRDTMPQLKEMIEHPTSLASPMGRGERYYVICLWCDFFNELIDAGIAIVMWRDRDVTSLLYHLLIMGAVYAFFFGLPFWLWKIGFLCAAVGSYLLFPLYYKIPVLRQRYFHPAMAFVWNWRRVLHRLFKEKVKQYLWPLPTALEPIPAEARHFEEWAQFHKNRETMRDRYHIETPPAKDLIPNFDPSEDSPSRWRGIEDWGTSVRRYLSAALKALPGFGRTEKNEGLSDWLTALDSKLRVHVMQINGLHDDLVGETLYVRVVSGQYKFKTKTSATGAFNVTYDFPGISGDAKVELWRASPQALVAFGSIGLMNGTKWVPLFDEQQVQVGEIRLYFLYFSDPKELEALHQQQQQEQQRAAETPPMTAAAIAEHPSRASALNPAHPPSVLPPTGAQAGADVLARADDLYADGEHVELHNHLKPHVAEGAEPAVLWWFARACYDAAGALPEAEKDAKKALYAEGISAAGICRKLHPEVAEGPKWEAILLSKLGQLSGTKEQVANSFVIKERADKAAELNPDDAATQHLLGAWHYNIAGISWAMRQAAKALFGTPPTSTYDAAIPHLLRAQKLDPSMIANSLMLGQTYMAVNQQSAAVKWLKTCTSLTAKTQVERDEQDEAKALLSKLE